MARYLLTVTDSDAARLERWAGGRKVIAPASGIGAEPVTVAGLDAITGEEYEFIARRLRTSGPLYHGRPAAGKPRRGFATALLAVALGLFAIIYAASALHALVASHWLSAGVCSSAAVVYGWAFFRAFGSLKETPDDAPH